MCPSSSNQSAKPGHTVAASPLSAGNPPSSSLLSLLDEKKKNVDLKSGFVYHSYREISALFAGSFNCVWSHTAVTEKWLFKEVMF